MPSVGTGYADVLPNLSKFGSELQRQMEPALKRVGRSLSSAGSTLTKFVTLPLVAAAGVSVKMAADFDRSFAKIRALAGSVGEPLAKAKEDVLALARATGQDPNSLAQALYFAASAGLRASQVFPVLRASAKAATIGMGDASTVVQTLTSVLNAYAGSGLDAAQAMDILAESVKLGKAEASDFAEGLGPVIGVAAQAGIRLGDLNAAIAQATNLGLPFNRAITAARYLIQNLIAPTDVAAEAMKNVGLTQQQVADMLTQPGGFEKVLQLIYQRTQDMGTAGRTAWRDITGGARGAVLAADLVGKHTEQTNEIVRQLGIAAGQSADEFATAYRKGADTASVRFQRALARLKTDAIDLGATLLPILQRDILPAIHKILAAWEGLSPATRTFIVQVAGIAAALGPVLLILGKVLTVASGIGRAFKLIGRGFGLVRPPAVTTPVIEAGVLRVGEIIAGGGVAGGAGGAAAAGGGATAGGIGANVVNLVKSWGLKGSLALAALIAETSGPTAHQQAPLEASRKAIETVKRQIIEGQVSMSRAIAIGTNKVIADGSKAFREVWQAAGGANAAVDAYRKGALELAREEQQHLLPAERLHAEALDDARHKVSGLQTVYDTFRRHVADDTRNIGQNAAGMATSVENAARRILAAIKRMVEAIQRAATQFGQNLLGGFAGAPPTGTIQRFAHDLVVGRFGPSQWGPFAEIVAHESGWNPEARNPSSNAGGIPQALPVTKLGASRPKWAGGTGDYKGQLQWMVGYIASVYGTPAAAWAKWQSRNPHWYGSGFEGIVRTPTLMGVGERGPERISISPLPEGMSRGRLVPVEGRLRLDESGDAFIRILAREEIADELAYRGGG